MVDCLNIAYVKARWHSEIVDQAQVGFETEMHSLGRRYILEIFAVPGALELPFCAQRLARKNKYDAIITVALVVNGGIYRHEFVAQAVIDGLMQVGLQTDVPVLSVSLTPHQFQETPEHIDFYKKHFIKKGAEAARAAVMMANL